MLEMKNSRTYGCCLYSYPKFYADDTTCPDVDLFDMGSQSMPGLGLANAWYLKAGN